MGYEFYCNCCGLEFSSADSDVQFDEVEGYVMCPECGAEHIEGEDDYITVYGM